MQAAVPPYGHVTEEVVQCIAQASSRYTVPELLLHAIITVEGGRTGKVVKNKNGSLDMGLAQINTSWLEYFSKFGITADHLIYNSCTNVQASAYILRYNANLFKQNWQDAIMAYNIGPNNWTDARKAIGFRYATQVISTWWGFQNWVDAYGAPRQLSSFPPEPAPSEFPR